MESSVAAREWLEKDLLYSGPVVDKTTINPHEVPHTVDSVQHGFLKDLFHSCSRQLSILCRAARDGSTLSRNAQTRLEGVQYTFLLLHDTFDGGKVESCFCTEDDLQEQVLTSLFDIGSPIHKGESSKPVAIADIKILFSVQKTAKGVRGRSPVGSLSQVEADTSTRDQQVERRRINRIFR